MIEERQPVRNCKLPCRHHGRDFRLTDVYGSVVKQLIASKDPNSDITPMNLIKDLEGLQFISSGLSGEAAEAERQKKRQEKQAAFRSFGSVGKRKMILDNDKASL